MTFGRTMVEMKKHIIESFKRKYGFAPTMKAIIPLESSGAGKYITWLAFYVNGIGYECHYQGDVERNDVYDM